MCKETTRLGGMVVFGGKVVSEEVFEEVASLSSTAG
jgi:hypothetical protein